MELKGFNQKDIIFSLDIGTRSIIGTVGIIKDKKFHVVCEKYMEHEERAMVDGQIHDISLVASVVQKVKNAIEEEVGIQLKEVSIAAAGRFLRTVNSKAELEIDGENEIDKEIIRSLELSAVKNAEEEINSTTEGKLYCVGYSVKSFYLNGFVISNLMGHKGEKIGAEVIATFLPRSVVDSLYSVMNKVNLNVVNLTLEPIAAMEAAVPKNLRLLNIALVDIGAGTSDIAISSKEAISAYGMVPMAGDEITEAIVQEYLVDFNTAERIKRELGVNSEITYVDILGMENVISSEAILKLIDNIVNKTADEISKKILELNGDKSPSAVFLVGGGAHTPGIVQSIAEKLNLPPQRIAIKDRSAVVECVSDNELGSAGVTVLGIALVAIRSLGNDFIDVNLNGEPISLFNSHKHNTMDVLLQAGINPSLLISKNGKSVRFTYNGCKRIVFGEYGANAKITINSEEATLETEVKSNDNIELVYAQNGKNAEPKLRDNIRNIDSVCIFIDDEIVNLEPVTLVNDKIENLEYIIKNGDEVRVFIPNTISDLKKYIIKENIKLMSGENILDDSYEVREGERLTRYLEISEDENLEETQNENSKEDISKLIAVDSEEITIEKCDLEDNHKDNNDKISVYKEEFDSINVMINGEQKIMIGKNEYVIVDIFDYIDFDLTVPKGNINITLNGVNAQYTAKLKDGDVVEVFWTE